MPKKKKLGPGKSWGPIPVYGEPMVGRITIVLTEKQAAAIREVAAAMGKTASTWAREVVLAAIPREVE
jgi:hypothetical protein